MPSEEISDIEFIKEILLRCQDCGKSKDDVRDRFCPYAADVYEKEVPITVCIDCYNNRADDI